MAFSWVRLGGSPTLLEDRGGQKLSVNTKKIFIKKDFGEFVQIKKLLGRRSQLVG